MELLLGAYFLWALFASGLVAGVASERGLSRVAWFVTSLVFTPILAAILLAASPAAPKGKEAGRVPCPWCAEAVLPPAVLCPFCRSDLSKAPPATIGSRLK
jgi:hypothetical protein